MGYSSFPNDQYNGRAVSLAEHEQLSIALGLSGMLFYGGTPPVFADSTGRQVKLRNGASAWIRGTRFNASETIIPIGPNTSGKTRVDLVVLRKRREESSLGAGDQHTVAPFVIQGVPADNPAAPSPVRDLTSAAGFYDVPLAEVTVTNGAATISAGQATCRAYYVNGTGYTGRDDWAKPPVEPGVIFRANDSGITYVGTTAGTWDPLYIDTGWVSITNGANKAGWNFDNFAVARAGNLVVLNMFITRTGGPLGAGTSQWFGPVPSQFRSGRFVYGAAHISSPDHSTHIAAMPDGQIFLAGNGSQGINTGGSVLGSLAWVTDSGFVPKTKPGGAL